MTCSVCKTPDLSPANERVVVCWCGIDLCAECVDAHGKQCEWFMAMKVKPEKKQAKKRPFPKIGHRSSVLTRRAQRA